MTSDEPGRPAVRIRREPPQFRRVTVARIEHLTPWMVRVTFTGPELDGLVVTEPGASVRLLLPPRGERDLAMPVWNGNEFLLAGGRRPNLRTFTPRRVDASELELDLDIVVHEGGSASVWARAAAAGDPAAISGPGRGYAVAPDAPAFLIGGDETAIPAISQLLEAVPVDAAVDVRIEVAHPDARIELPGHPRAKVEWCDLPAGAPPGDALVAAIRSAEVVAGGRVWVAGEAAAVQRIRRYLFEELGMARSLTSVRGYWKFGRTGDAEAD